MTVGVGADGIAGTGDEAVLAAYARPEIEITGKWIHRFHTKYRQVECSELYSSEYCDLGKRTVDGRQC